MHGSLRPWGAEAMEEDAEWDPEEGEAETSEPEAAGPEPLWLEPPVHDAVVEATSSASASSASPPVHGASSASARVRNVTGSIRFLFLLAKL